jgi:hypothetical protein
VLSSWSSPCSVSPPHDQLTLIACSSLAFLQPHNHSHLFGAPSQRAPSRPRSLNFWPYTPLTQTPNKVHSPPPGDTSETHPPPSRVKRHARNYWKGCFSPSFAFLASPFGNSNWRIPGEVGTRPSEDKGLKKKRRTCTGDSRGWLGVSEVR